MADPRWRVKSRHLKSWRRNQQIWYHFVEQALDYLINVNLFRCALTEGKPKGGFIHPVQGLKSVASLKTFKQNWIFLVSFLKPTFLWVCGRIIQRDPTYYSAVWKGQLAFQFNMENYARFTKQFYLT